MTTPRTWITIEQAAEQLGVSKRTIRRYISDGFLPAYRVADHYIRIAQDDLDQMMVPIPTYKR
jgi:excisionase family DNA binding protein